MIYVLAPCTSNGARHHYSADHNHKWDKDLQILHVTIALMTESTKQIRIFSYTFLASICPLSCVFKTHFYILHFQKGFVSGK